MTCLALAIVSPLLLFGVLRLKSSVSPAAIQAKTAKRKDVESLTYVATFLVPFLTVSADAPRKQLALAIFILLIYFLYVKGEVYFWNPILSLRGYYTMEVEVENGEAITLITPRGHIKQSREIRAIALTNHVYWEPKQ